MPRIWPNLVATQPIHACWYAIAQRYDVPIKAAALQFSLPHPATDAVIPGASKPERIAEDYAALNTKIPDDFWHEMRDQHLVAANAPLPVDNPTRHGRLDIIKPRPAART